MSCRRVLDILVHSAWIHDTFIVLNDLFMFHVPLGLSCCAVKRNVSVLLTMVCLYGQDCCACVSNVIIYPAEGNNFSHLTQ